MASFWPGSSWSHRRRGALAMARCMRWMQVQPWRWCAPPAWHPGTPRRRSVSSASPRRTRSTTLSRWRACWWMANSGSFASRQTAPTTGRLRVWPRKRRMRPWWTFQIWPNRLHPAWTPATTKSSITPHQVEGRSCDQCPRSCPDGSPGQAQWATPSQAGGGQDWGSEGFPPGSGQGDEVEAGHTLWSHWTPQRLRKQSHWLQKSWGRCRVGPSVWQTRRLWEPRCSDSWTWSTTRVLEEELLGWPRGQHPARSNQHRESQGAELGTTGPWTEDRSLPPSDPRTAVLLVSPSQSSIRAECLCPGIWDGWCDGHWPWGSDHRVQGDEGLPADQQHEAICPQAVLGASWDTSEGTGARRGDGGTSPPGLQACPPHTDVQSSLRRTVWRSLEVGLWTFQSTQVGQAAETGGADSPRDPDASSWLEELELPCLYTEEDVKKQVEAGLRPAPESIRGGFWAPYDEERYWQRQTQTWTLPALFHVYRNAWTMKELYGIWCEMPLMIQRSRRGQGETAKQHQANLQKTKDEVQQFLDANNLGRPQSPAEWRQWASSWQCGRSWPTRHRWWWRFRWPQSRMTVNTWSWGPSAMRESASLWTPSRITRDLLPADQLMDVKVAWRCNTTQYWHAEVDAAAAGPLYAKLGYPAATIEAMNLNPFGGHVNLTAQGAKLLGEEPAHSGHPNPGPCGHSPAPFITIEGDDGKDYEAERKPPITVNNVVSACGKDYMRKSYPGGRRAHGMWLGFEQCQPLGNGPKREGCDTWRLLLQMVQGFLEGKDGELPLSSNHLGNVVLQMVLDEPPERLYNRWVNQQLLSAMCPWRLIPTQCTAWGSASPMGWARLVMPFGTLCWRILRRPAWKASTMWRTSTSGTECIRWPPPFCLLFVFALRLMDPPGCTLILLQQGGPRRELIATSLWEPTGWINRHLPGIDPRPMTGKKCGAAGSLTVTRQPGFHCWVFPWFFVGEFFTLWHCCMWAWMWW